MQTLDATPSPKKTWNDGRIEEFNEAVFSIIEEIERSREGNGSAEVNLDGTVFPGQIDFTRYDSDRPLPNISFVDTTFCDFSDFQGVVFSGSADFKESNFSANARFNKTRFTGMAHFEDAKFRADVEFSGAVFFERATFENATFNYAEFNGTTFHGDADFERFSISYQIMFSKADVRGSADFSGTSGTTEESERARSLYVKSATQDVPDEQARMIKQVAAIGDSKTFPSALFDSVHFHGMCDFNNRQFLDRTSFNNTIFEYAPKFHNTRLHQDTDFMGAKFRDVRSDDAARNYRTLKLAMEQVRARQEEAMFFALEQRSLRHRADTPRLACWASWIYDWTSDYGQNFLRPVTRAAQLLAASWLVYWIAFGYFAVPSGPPMGHAGDIFVFALQQIFRPFELWTSRYAMLQGLSALGTGGIPFLVKLVATVQSLATFGLLTLFLLSLRKRFRMI
ncbi:MAG: pentapeptide repeat-containing protein [Alphaproteobacteria bacterium]